MENDMSEKCTCRVCTYGRKVQDHLASVKAHSPASYDFFTDMHVRLCNAQMERDAYRAMLAGDWPAGRLVFIPTCEKAHD